jgi:hypothetical protein
VVGPLLPDGNIELVTARPQRLDLPGRFPTRHDKSPNAAICHKEQENFKTDHQSHEQKAGFIPSKQAIGSTCSHEGPHQAAGRAAELGISTAIKG